MDSPRRTIPIGFILFRHSGFTNQFLYHFYFIWPRITDESVIPETSLWSILLILPVIDWYIQSKTNLFFDHLIRTCAYRHVYEKVELAKNLHSLKVLPVLPYCVKLMYTVLPFRIFYFFLINVNIHLCLKSYLSFSFLKDIS